MCQDANKNILQKQTIKNGGNKTECKTYCSSKATFEAFQNKRNDCVYSEEIEEFADFLINGQTYKYKRHHILECNFFVFFIP